jgi:hypothetical protein
MPYTHSERFTDQERKDLYTDLLLSMPRAHHCTDDNWMFDALSGSFDAPSRSRQAPRRRIGSMMAEWFTARLLPQRKHVSLT